MDEAAQAVISVDEVVNEKSWWIKPSSSRPGWTLSEDQTSSAGCSFTMHVGKNSGKQVED